MLVVSLGWGAGEGKYIQECTRRAPTEVVILFLKLVCSSKGVHDITMCFGISVLFFIHFYILFLFSFSFLSLLSLTFLALVYLTDCRAVLLENEA